MNTATGIPNFLASPGDPISTCNETVSNNLRQHQARLERSTEGFAARFSTQLSQWPDSVNYRALTDEASWFDEGPCSAASPQASIRAVPALLHSVLVSLGQVSTGQGAYYASLAKH